MWVFLLLDFVKVKSICKRKCRVQYKRKKKLGEISIQIERRVKKCPWTINGLPLMPQKVFNNTLCPQLIY